MFSIHGITGQTFRGTLELLIQVPGVSTARYARGINREGEEFGVEAIAAKRKESPGQEQAVAVCRRIARVFLEYRQSGVPIIDERETLVGFASRGDIPRAVTTDPPRSLWA